MNNECDVYSLLTCLVPMPLTTQLEHPALRHEDPAEQDHRQGLRRPGKLRRPDDDGVPVGHGYSDGSVGMGR